MANHVVTDTTLFVSQAYASRNFEAVEKLIAEHKSLAVKFVKDLPSKRAFFYLLEQLRALPLENATFSAFLLTPAQQQLLQDVAAVQEEASVWLKKTPGSYTFSSPAFTNDSNYRLTEHRITRLSGNYCLAVSTGYKIFKECYACWSSAGEKERRWDQRLGQADRSCKVDAGELRLGCQIVHRNEVEWLARHYGWFEQLEAEQA